jgi:hypothetical protein
MTKTSTPAVTIAQAKAELARRATPRPHAPAKCAAAKAMLRPELLAIAAQAPAKKAPAKVADPMKAEAARVATDAGDAPGSGAWWASYREVLAELRMQATLPEMTHVLAAVEAGSLVEVEGLLVPAA